MAENENLEPVRVLLRRIIDTRSCSVGESRELETTILLNVPSADDDARFEDLMYILACYNPAGGPYLRNTSDLVHECELVLPLLGSEQDSR
jgi:hypothetical protein